jgi:uncharacterized protein (TIGR03000 family)
MRSFGFVLVPGVLLLGVAPSEAVAQRGRAMITPFRPMATPFRPMISPFRPGVRMFHPGLFHFHSRRLVFSPVYQLGYGGYGMGYGGYGVGHGGYGMYAMPYGGYSSYQMPYGGYGLSGAPALLPQASTASDVEVSGPLDKPPPHRAVIRVRLPQSQADVSFDGKKVDTFGKSRTYVTPELTGSRAFEVTATWTQNGRTSSAREQVTVSAGQVRTLDFTSGK